MADENLPATKKDLHELSVQTKNDIQALKTDLRETEDRLKTDLRETEDRLKTDLRETEDRLSEQMRDLQTELLKAFLPWQDNVRIQFRELEVNTGNSVQSVKLRMDTMERRLGEIEKKLLLKPPAA